MVNLITRMDSMEMVCRLCGETLFWRFLGKISL